MEMHAVSSKLISEIGYDEDQFVLAVKFANGGLYHYDDVSPEVYGDLITASSLGGYFIRNIKAKYAARRVNNGNGATNAPIEELPENPQELKQVALEFQQKVTALAINSAEHYVQAAEELKIVAQKRKQAQERIDRLKKPAYKAYREVLELEKDVMAPYDAAERHLKNGIAAYRAEEERRRRAEERRLQQDAQKRAEEEARKRTEEIAIREAEIAEAQGDTITAEAILTSPREVIPAFVSAVVLPKEVPQVESISAAKNWKFRIVDESLIPRAYLLINEAAIGQVVRSLKSKAPEVIPGIEVYSEDIIRVRT